MQHNEMMNAMVELERAINKAHKIAETNFMETGHTLGFGSDKCTFWYGAMKCIEAMTDIKCAIDIHPE